MIKDEGRDNRVAGFEERTSQDSRGSKQDAVRYFPTTWQRIALIVAWHYSLARR